MSGPACLRMIHTREGAHAFNMMLTHAGARQRKVVVKALKGQVGRIVRDDHASIAVACLLDCVDDTRLSSKVIIAELRNEGIFELACDRAARRVLLHALRPRSTRYIHPHALATLPDPAEVRRAVEENKKALALGGHGVGGEEDRDADVEDADVEEDEADGDDEMMDDEMMDDEFGEEEEEEEPRMTKRRSRAAEAGGDDDDDDDDAPAGGGDDSVDFGISRKDAETRRRELFGKEGHLARSLVAACATNASAMLRSPEACDVLFETCSGGAGGVVVDGVGVEQLAELHDAVAEAARASVAGEEPEEEEEEEGEGGAGGDEKPRLPLHEDYFSTRTLRRMVLEIPGAASPIPGTASAGGSGAAAAAGTGTPPPVFATSLWESAVSRDPNAWIDGHGAKVVAALARQVADDAVAAEAKKAIGARVKNKTPEEWIAGFFKRFDKSKSSKGEGEGGAKKKAAEKKAAEKPATEKKKDGGGGLAPVKTKKTAKKDGGGDDDADAAKAPKSPKELKFSPRATRAQRAEKLAKAGGKKK